MARRPNRPAVAVPIAGQAPGADSTIDPADPVGAVRTWVAVPAWTPFTNARMSDYLILAGFAFVATAVVFALIAAGALIYTLFDLTHLPGTR